MPPTPTTDPQTQGGLRYIGRRRQQNQYQHHRTPPNPQIPITPHPDNGLDFEELSTGEGVGEENGQDRALDPEEGVTEGEENDVDADEEEEEEDEEGIEEGALPFQLCLQRKTPEQSSHLQQSTLS
jgi:hypothetical protein